MDRQTEILQKLEKLEEQKQNTLNRYIWLCTKKNNLAKEYLELTGGQ